MKKLIFLFLSLTIISCSKSDDTDDPIFTEGFSTFKVEFSKNGNTDEWFEELDFKTSPSGWNISTSNEISDGDIEGSEIVNEFTIVSKSKIPELEISYFATPYFDGVNYLDNATPTFLNVTFKIYENDILIDTKTLSLDGSNRATKDFEYTYSAE